MGFEYHKHTADIKIRCFAPALEQAFSQAAKAFTGILTEEQIKEQSTESFEISAESKESLFFEFLDQLVFLLDTKGFVGVYLDADILDLGSQWVLDGVLRGDNISSYEHSGDIKAPTLHELSVEYVDTQWVCTAVLDL